MLIEYTAISLYLVILALITWVSSHKQEVGSFLFASRNVTWFPLSVSIFSSVISSYNFVVILTFAFIYGPYVLLIFLGVLLAFISIYLITNKYKEIIRNHNFSNIIDFFAQRFDNRVATALNLALAAALLLFIALQFFVNTSIFSELLGWSKYTSALIVGFIVFLYTTLGGLKTEIFTDVFQGILMLAVGILAFMVDTTVITTDTITRLLTDTEVIIAATSLGFVQFLTLTVQPEIWQRVAAAKTLKSLKKAFITAWVFLLIIVIPLIIIGLAAQAGGGIENPSNILLDILKNSAPAWYLPILLTSLFAALMSTIDSSLFAVSTQLGKYGFVLSEENSKPSNTDESGAQIVSRTRVAIGAVITITLASSLFFGSFLSGVFNLISLLTIISTAVILSLIFGMSTTETLASILVGIGLFVGAFAAGYITEKPITTLYPSVVLLGYVLIQTSVIKCRNYMFLSNHN